MNRDGGSELRGAGKSHIQKLNGPQAMRPQKAKEGTR
jgi:hypothetical protein